MRNCAYNRTLGHDVTMADQPHAPEDHAPDASALGSDPAGLRDSLERTGRYLKKAGLPFEADEFDDNSAEGESASEAGSDTVA